MNKLVDKWFKGGDVPLAQDNSLHTLRYETVSGSLFVNGASFSDIDQGDGINDCYFLAALGNTALHSPSTIQNMFADNGDGTWTVRFYNGGVANYVTVNRQLPVFGLGFGSAWAAGFGVHYDEYGMMFQNNFTDPKNELWVALAEKAYVQANESGWTGQDGTNSYHGIDLGQATIAMKQVSGKSFSVHKFSKFPATTPTEMINAISRGHAVVLSTLDSAPNPRLTPNHDYIVLGYNSVTKMFQVYNPHGLWNHDGPQSSNQTPYVEMDWGAILNNCEGWQNVLL